MGFCLTAVERSGLVYRLVVRNGGVAEYEQVLNIFRTADVQEERLRALDALGAAGTLWLLFAFCSPTALITD